METQKIVQLAIQNNIDLYKAVFRGKGVSYEQNEDIFYSLEKVPPYYSNIVTASKDWKPDQIFTEIALESWSIKDSFHSLDLSTYGMRKLFDAKWLYLKSDAFAPVQSEDKLRFSIVDTKEELAKWKKVWESEEMGDAVFDTSLLENKDLSFIAGYKNGVLVTGSIINKTENVLGISNFFSPAACIPYWSAVIEYVFEKMGKRDIVGYEREATYVELKELGFESVGDLSVWLR